MADVSSAIGMDGDEVPVVSIPAIAANSRQKRIFDFAIAVGAIIFLAPALLVIALAVKLTSRGPILFRQVRNGRGRAPFTIYKFRSMTVAACGDAVVQAQKGDARMTPLGRFLRRASLDELPQLFNVINGSMSLVGPRPHAIKHDDEYLMSVPSYEKRYVARPGITGLAQVQGLRGPTPTLDLMERRVVADLEYLKNWSLRLDLEILLKTCWVVFSGKNAV